MSTMNEDDVEKMLDMLKQMIGMDDPDIKVPVDGKDRTQFAVISCIPLNWIDPPANNVHGIKSCPIHVTLNFDDYKDVPAAILVDKNGNYRFGTDFWKPQEFDDLVREGKITFYPNQDIGAARYMICDIKGDLEEAINLYHQSITSSKEEAQTIWKNIMESNGNLRYAFMMAVMVGESLAMQLKKKGYRSSDGNPAYNVTDDMGASMLAYNLKNHVTVVNREDGAPSRLAVRDCYEVTYIFVEAFTVIENMMYTDVRFNPKFKPQPEMKSGGGKNSHDKRLIAPINDSGAEISDMGSNLLQALSKIKI